jgi:hypothetical protein
MLLQDISSDKFPAEQASLRASYHTNLADAQPVQRGRSYKVHYNCVVRLHHYDIIVIGTVFSVCFL